MLLLIRLFLCSIVAASSPSLPSKPNILIFFVDDLGYGDVGFNGHPTIRTPNIDRYAREGMKLTRWYSGAPLCTASRSAMMTGRLPVRVGLAGGNWLGGVLKCDAEFGLPTTEVTMAQQLKRANYTTHAIGKWHLGQRPEYLPHRRGFDSYLGIPFSVDMGTSAWQPNPTGWTKDCTPLPLLRDDKVIEAPVNLHHLTDKYTDEALRVLGDAKHSKSPFLLYFAHSHVHTPQFGAERNCNRSQRGFYGNALEEVDDAIGRVMEVVEAEHPNTLVIFTSDNGPWTYRRGDGGSAGLLRGAKGSTWEGGIRMPAFVWMKGYVKPNLITDAVVSTMDLFVTASALASVPLPPLRQYDGRDVSRVFFASKSPDAMDSPHRFIFHYRGTPTPHNETLEPGVWAVSYTESRDLQWKAHYLTKSGFGTDPVLYHHPPLLFNLAHDPSERYPIDLSGYLGARAKAALQKIDEARAAHVAGVKTVPNMAQGEDPKWNVCGCPNSPLHLRRCTCQEENFNLLLCERVDDFGHTTPGVAP